MRLIVTMAVLLVLPLALMAQQPDFTVFDAKGKPASIKDIVKRLEKVDVLFLGESHDDSVGHRVQYSIFKQAIKKHGARRTVALSLEMFERDVQATLDEYLTGLISEKQFLDAARPWGNYKTDYRPLVELAREKSLAVIAANAPRRYVNMVSR
ncbi:MAG: ChaN family lipoprotein, partial [Acidobacteriota bacterium]|nr:ChaN family lipoprotein [Acidobacteriota bacterium]